MGNGAGTDVACVDSDQESWRVIRSGELMEENTTPAKLLFMAVLVDSALDHFSLISEHQSSS